MESWPKPQIFIWIKRPLRMKQQDRKSLKPLILKRFKLSPIRNGGDNGIRTRDLCNANAALSHLSYTPI